LIALYEQLPNEYKAFYRELQLAAKARQLFGLSWADLEAMDDFDREMLRATVMGNG